MTELRQRMIEDMRLRGLSEATQRTYLDAIANLASHFKRSRPTPSTCCASSATASSPSSWPRTRSARSWLPSAGPPLA